jgi:hypothetical protein
LRRFRGWMGRRVDDGDRSVGQQKSHGIWISPMWFGWMGLKVGYSQLAERVVRGLEGPCRGR